MTKTNMAVLDQACRNTVDHGWFVEMRRIDPAGEFWAPRGAVNCSIRIRTEYARLMRLKARKKGWRGNVSQNTKHQHPVSNSGVTA